MRWPIDEEVPAQQQSMRWSIDEEVPAGKRGGTNTTAIDEEVATQQAIDEEVPTQQLHVIEQRSTAV